VRVSDAPERSIPRTQWGQATEVYMIESLDERFHAARRLGDDLAVVSLLLTHKASRDGQDRSYDSRCRRLETPGWSLAVDRAVFEALG